MDQVKIRTELNEAPFVKRIKKNPQLFMTKEIIIIGSKMSSDLIIIDTFTLRQLHIPQDDMPIYHIKINYGPTDTIYRITHRPQLLNGLRFSLQKLGHRVDLVPIKEYNLCKIESCGIEIFRCELNKLMFNMPADRDPVCQGAVAALTKATDMLERARTYFWIYGLLDDAIFTRHEHGPTCHWLEHIHMKPFNKLCCALKCGARRFRPDKSSGKNKNSLKITGGEVVAGECMTL